MSDKIITDVVTIAVAIVGLAIIATVVSQKANTSNVIASAGKSFASILGAAVKPVTSGTGI